MIPMMGGGGGYPDSGPKRTKWNPESTSLVGIYFDEESTRDQSGQPSLAPDPRALAPDR